MKKQLQIVMCAALLFTGAIAHAQDSENIAPKSDKDQKNAIAVYTGLPGIGIGYARKMNDHLSVRVKGSFFNTSVERKGETLGSRKVDLDAAFQFNTYDLLLDYLPFKKSSFKIVSGVSYVQSGNLDILIKPAGNLKYGDITLTPDQIGEITSGADWSSLASYLAIGFGRSVPKNRIGFGFEIGGYFVGKPETTFDTSKMLTPTIDEKEEFEDWMSKLTFIPSLMFHLNCKF